MFANPRSWNGPASPFQYFVNAFFGTDGEGGRSRHRRRGHHGHGSGSGGPFGGRRPLRFLARRLGLDDDQLATISRVLGDLKIERAQLALDSRRAAARFADALSSDEFDDQRISEGRTIHGEAHKRFQEAFVRALREVHAVLTPEQRSRLSMLLREMPPWAM